MVFSGNSASNGGAMFNYAPYGYSKPSLVNVTFAGNIASGKGGAMHSGGVSGNIQPKLSNVILWGNTAAGQGSQLYNYNDANLTLNYTLIQSDSNAIVNADAGAVVYGSDIITGDPLFANALGADGISGTLDDDLRLLPGSPAIDSGDNGAAPADDINGVSRPVNGVVDLGAHESQGFSLTISGGNNQTTPTDTAFANPLQVTVSSATGEPVGPGGVISFTGPDTWAGLNPTAVTATTNASGVASAAVTANQYGGSYSVAATAAGVSNPATFTLTNTGIITLSLDKQVELVSNPAKPGETLTYTIVVANSGNQAATNVTIQDFLPAGLSGTSLMTTTTVGAGESLTYTLSATILNIPGNYTATIANTAYLYHASGNLSDTVTFTTISDTMPPPNPTLITPANGSTITNTDNLTFSWSTVTDGLSGLDYYTLQVESENDGLSIQTSSDSITTTQTVYTPTNVLANGVYTWTVRAHDNAGNVSSGLTATFTISATTSTGTIYLPIVVKNN